MTTRVAEYASFKIALSSLSKLGNSLRPREKEKKEEKKKRKIQLEIFEKSNSNPQMRSQIGNPFWSSSSTSSSSH